MSNNTAIEFNHVSKMYQLGIVGTGTISNDIKRWWAMSVRGKEDPFLKVGQTNDRATKGTSDFVYALRDIDFKVEQGDVVGIIGKNGAGKSTLLKLLSRITAPTTGTIKAKGRIASLLEVGTGFHPELTGRENIYMNGTIMGMKRQEIDAKLDEIVDFAGVERYLDTPTKRYSSGMTVRLGFAVAAFLEPEILVVDEVLAVGDAEFQKKAIGKMQDVSQGQGRTVLFVSHNMASVRKLCNHGILLENGMVKTTGGIVKVIEDYISGCNLDIRERKWNKKGKKVAIIGVELIVDGKNTNQTIDMTDRIFFRMTYFVESDINNTNISFTLFKEGVDLFHSWDLDSIPELGKCRRRGTHVAEIELPNILLPGIYDISVDIGAPNIGVIDAENNCLQFEISNVTTDGMRASFTRGGMFKTNINWKDTII